MILIVSYRRDALKDKDKKWVAREEPPMWISVLQNFKRAANWMSRGL
jgi:hypothetical protein